MFVYRDGENEYLAGKHKRKIWRRLRRNRVDPTGWKCARNAALTMGGPLSVTIGGGIAMSEAFAMGGLAALPFGVVAMIYSTLAPIVRQDDARELERDGLLINQDHILYRMVMTEEVIGSLRWGEIYEDDEDYRLKTKLAVDEFLAFMHPHTNNRFPERSDFVGPEWELEIDEATGEPHGPLHEHPMLVAIADAIYDYDDTLVNRVRRMVGELRVEREEYLREQFETQDKLANEVGRKLVLTQEANARNMLESDKSEQTNRPQLGGITGWPLW